MPKTEIDHELTHCAVCPHCGLQHEDSFDWEKDSGEVTCDRCGKTFSYERETTVTYTTEAI